MSMPPINPNIDLNRRNFIKASLALAGAFVLGKVSGVLSASSKIASTTSALSAAPKAPPVRVKEYRNVQYGFSLIHPSDLAVSTFDEGGGASTVTFQNVEKAEGFQIFIVPHSDSQVSEERFNQDVPSGVRESLENVVIDGATGASFYSTNSALGDTHEVWVAHNKGFLYELTTLAPLDTHLDSIIQTWRFV